MFGKFPGHKTRRVTLPRVRDRNASNSYSTIQTDSGNITADDEEQTLSIVGGTGITVSASEGSPDEITISGTEGVTDHTELTNIGTNTHDQIDTHIADTSNPHSVSISELENSETDKTFTMANKTITWRFTNPSGGMFFEWTGAASGHLFEINQNTGNPTAGTHLLHIEAEDADALPLHLLKDGNIASNQLLVMEGNRSSPTNNDEVYSTWQLSNDNGDQIEYGRISAVAIDVTDDTEEGGFTFDIVDSGSLSEKLRITSTDVQVSNSLLIVGDADKNQLVIKADDNQTIDNPVFMIQNSSGTDLLSITTDSTTNIFIGLNAGIGLTEGNSDNNIFIGDSAGRLATDVDLNICIGRQAMYYNKTGDRNTCIGYRAGYGASNQNYSDCTFIGNAVGQNNKTATRNLGIGTNALNFNETGNDNVCVGYRAGYGASGNSFTANVFVGSNAGGSTTTGGNNVAMGGSALRDNTTGSFNFALGTNSCRYTQTGNKNVMIGYLAGYGVSGNSYSDNVGAGYGVGTALTTGGRNILLGTDAGANLTTGGSNILIGYQINASTATTSNELNIGGLIKGDTSASTIQLNGTTTVKSDSVIVETSQSPASNGTGTAGEIAWDGSYLYVCTATDTWARVAITGGY